MISLVIESGDCGDGGYTRKLDSCYMLHFDWVMKEDGRAVCPPICTAPHPPTNNDPPYLYRPTNP